MSGRNVLKHSAKQLLRDGNSKDKDKRRGVHRSYKT